MVAGAYLPTIAAGASQQPNLSQVDNYLVKTGMMPSDELNNPILNTQGMPSLAPYTNYIRNNDIQDMQGYYDPNFVPMTPDGQGTAAPAGMHYEQTMGGGDQGGVSYDLVKNDPNSQYQQFLDAMNKYGAAPHEEVTSGGDQPNTMYNFQFDPSKIPGADGQHAMAKEISDPSLWNSGGAGMNIPFMTTPSDKARMYNPNLTYDSSTWGDITSGANYKPEQDFMTHMMDLGRMATMGTLGAAFGMAGASALGPLFSSMGAGGLSNTLGSMAGKLGFGELTSGGQMKLNPLQLASQVAGGIPGVSDVMSTISPYVNGASAIYNATQGSPWQLINMGLQGIRGH